MFQNDELGRFRVLFLPFFEDHHIRPRAASPGVCPRPQNMFYPYTDMRNQTISHFSRGGREVACGRRKSALDPDASVDPVVLLSCRFAGSGSSINPIVPSCRRVF